MTLSALGIFSAAGAGGVAGDYELIASTVLGTATPSVVFDVSSLASTYKHLQLRYVARSASTNGEGRIRLNADTGSNYAFHQLVGDGSSVFSGFGLSRNGMDLLSPTTSSATANNFGVAVVDFLDVFSSTKNTTARSFVGVVPGGVLLRSALWLNTAAVTSITVYIADGANYVTGSRFSLYGIKG